MPINRETVSWYALQMGLKIENSSQYDEAEKLLKKRLSGGYWKIIARGDPLTEEAGDCQEEYCLVRGVDACTVCRDKDIILKGSQSSKQSDRKELSPPASPKNQSQQTAESDGGERLFEYGHGLDWWIAWHALRRRREIANKREKIPSDLMAAIILALATLVFTLTPLSDLPVRVPLGLLMVLFVPGYTLIAALFPKIGDLDGIERTALSLRPEHCRGAAHRPGP